MNPEENTADLVARFDFAATLARIAEEVRDLVGQGKVAAYIPRLAEVPADRFGMAVATLDGRVFEVGDAATPFSIQSISKVFTLTLALEALGGDLWKRVGREPSGSAFNSLVQLERESGIPRNPLINAGAHVVADVILSSTPTAQADLLEFVRARADNRAIVMDEEVAASERDAGFRNAALANFIRSFRNLDNPVERVLDFYFHQCALQMSCLDLARAFLYLANRGRCQRSGQSVISAERAKRINALMLTCGTYDAAGEFAFRVGLPAKSGVGGGIVAVVPNALTLAVWSPGLDEKGNSLAGAAALDRFTALTGLSIF
ncbi:glutaminase [Dokdonella immobilis]|uniref:Glutaminase n=1 Tax=Dokdonella immobilis TaxID=578942 RepID=A0A1I4VU40_9GAMM|nr:glutaminase [Dokdonella immobilis]SFN04506.1 L-glutaminase [Dokdonella immobilis]